MSTESPEGTAWESPRTTASQPPALRCTKCSPSPSNEDWDGMPPRMPHVGECPARCARRRRAHLAGHSPTCGIRGGIPSQSSFEGEGEHFVHLNAGGCDAVVRGDSQAVPSGDSVLMPGTSY